MEDAVKTNVIYQTTDYNKFRKMKGNRDVEDARVKNIVKSIEKIGWISNPIIVNKKMEVIDGQGRLEALKRLGLPVEYHIVEDADLEDCRTMNSNLKSWGTMDYVKSYSQTKNADYERINTIMNYFKVSFDTVMSSIGKSCSGRNFEIIKNGQLEFSECDYINASKRLNIHKKYYPVLSRFGGNKRVRNKVIFWLINYGETHENIDHDKIVETLENCDPQMIYPQNFERLLESIQEAYNFGRRKRETRLYFYEEYRLDSKIKG